MNVKNAFMNGDLSEKVYMKPSSAYRYPHDKVLCGLKQAPKAWFAKFSFTICQLRFYLKSYDKAFFICETEKGCTLLLLYIDDMIITGDDMQGIKELK